MICDCPLANVCVHATKRRTGWVQFAASVGSVGALAAPWVAALIAGRVLWGWM